MNIWINIWTVFLIVSLVIFAVLAVVVTIGGFFNILSLLKGLSQEDESQGG